MNKATFIKQVNGTGDGAVYRLDPPLAIRDYDGNVESTTEHVWVSATVVPFGGGPETYIFACDAAGKVTNWGELPGSYKGGLNHGRALAGAGYEVS